MSVRELLDFRAGLEMALKIAQGRATHASEWDNGSAREVAYLTAEIRKIDEKIAAAREADTENRHLAGAQP